MNYSSDDAEHHDKCLRDDSDTDLKRLLIIRQTQEIVHLQATHDVVIASETAPAESAPICSQCVTVVIRGH